MKRNNIFEVTQNILDILEGQRELSINQISEKVNCQWRTAQKSLRFLKKIGMVSEREGKKSFKAERLFSRKY